MRSEARRFLIGLSAALAVSSAGCLGDPPIEERWTRLEILDVRTANGDSLRAGSGADLLVRGRITYRGIVTGFVAAQVVSSDSLAPRGVRFDADDDPEAMARDVARVLAQGQSLSGASRAVTGFDHLIQGVEFELAVTVPAFSEARDSLHPPGVFVVLYLGEGEEVEMSADEDTLIVTPFDADERQVLAAGLVLYPIGPGELLRP